MHTTIPPSPLRQSATATTRARATSEVSTSQRYFQDLGTRPPAAASSFLSAGIPNPYGAAGGGDWQSNMDDGTFATSGFGFYPSPLPSPSPTDHDPMGGGVGSSDGKRHLQHAKATAAAAAESSHHTARSTSASSASSSRTQTFFSTDHRPELLLPPRPLAKEPPSSPLRDGMGATDGSSGTGTFIVSGLNRARSMHERRSSRQLDDGGGDNTRSIISLDDEGHAVGPTHGLGLGPRLGSTPTLSGLDRTSSLKRRQYLQQQQQQKESAATPFQVASSGSPKSNDLFKTSFAVAPPSKSSSASTSLLSGGDDASEVSGGAAAGSSSSMTDSPTVLSPVSPTFGIAAVMSGGGGSSSKSKAAGWSSLGRGPSPAVVAGRLSQLQRPAAESGNDLISMRSATMPASTSASSSISSTLTARLTMNDAPLQPITRAPTLLPPSPASTHGFSAFHHGGGDGERAADLESTSRSASASGPSQLSHEAPMPSSLLSQSPVKPTPPVRRLTREPSNFEHRPLRRGFRVGPVGDDQPDQGKRQWELEEVMGAGAFSVVWSARECACERAGAGHELQGGSGRGQYGAQQGLVAIKMMDRRICRENDRTRVSFLREVAVLKQISHPHIVSYVSSFWTPEYNCLVLEHLSGGELFELLQQPGNHKRMDEPLLRRIFTELCRGIHWLHVAGIVHRDIKLENIMFTVNPFTTSTLPETLVKITDFGLARFIDPASPLLRTRCGSESFAAPEIVMGQPYDGRKTDAWATGVLLFTLITGELPFDSSGSPDDTTSRRKRMMRIARGTYEWPANNSGSPGARCVVSKLLVRDPARRSNIDRSLWDEAWMQGPGAVPRPAVYESHEPIDGRKVILDGYLIEDSSSDLSHQEIT